MSCEQVSFTHENMLDTILCFRPFKFCIDLSLVGTESDFINLIFQHFIVPNPTLVFLYHVLLLSASPYAAVRCNRSILWTSEGASS